MSASNYSSDSTTSTLARLSFWISSDRIDEFEAVYEERVAPLLQRHDLVESSRRSRPVVEGVFCRLFAIESPVAVAEKHTELERDLEWQKIIEELRGRFGTAGSEGDIWYSFRLYSAPADFGRVVPNESQKGYWRTFDTASGLAEDRVFVAFQDREGNLWFGTEGGASRYDGESFTTFTIKDGLAHDTVLSIYQDREGNLWFGTFGGLSRCDGESFTTLTTRDGLVSDLIRHIHQDRKGTLWFGSGLLGISGGGISRFDGSTFAAITTRDGLAHNSVSSIYEDTEGYLWFGTRGGGASRYDGESFTTFTTRDGLAHNSVSSIYEDREGYLWFGTFGGGASRYDGKSFTSFTTQDGLVNNLVSNICEDREGYLWFGTFGGGASRYDGENFATLTTQDGLTYEAVWSILQDREGYLWFATYGGGVSRYDDQSTMTFSSRSPVTGILQDRRGRIWISTLHSGVVRYEKVGANEWERVNFSIEEGQIDDVVRCIFQDRQGRIWIGFTGGCISRCDGSTWETFTLEDGFPRYAFFTIEEDREGNIWFGTQGGGAYRYDGESFANFTVRDGLAHNDVRSILQDREGDIWFGTFGGGLSRCRLSETGEFSWTTFTTDDGLGSNYLQERAVFQDREGHIWFGTNGGGVTCFDGSDFLTFTIEDGLAHDIAWAIEQDEEGDIWIGTSGGLNRYDGKVFQKMTQEDGLPSTPVWSLFRDREEQIWIGTIKGLTRYSPRVSAPPMVAIDAVVANQRFEEVAEISVPYSTGLTAFEFHGVSSKTRPEGMVYRYRLKGHDADWRNTSRRRVEYQELPVGDYLYEVVAVDRDLAYSEQPATVRLEVIPDPRDEQIDELEERVRERTRQLEETHRQLEETQARFIDELEGELQTAHDLQMGLMPERAPQLEGFDIAGRCVPATHVGGDFFQYFPLSGNRLAIAVADVTGHAMEAAIPVVMFSGILKTEMRFGLSLERLFEDLNTNLCESLGERTFVCFTMGEIDLEALRFRLANGGCPYPYHFQAASGELVELQVDAYPLGVRSGSSYQVEETQLQPGDRLVFCSDGIVEAEDIDGKLFGFEATAKVICTGCRENLSSEQLLERIFAEVEAFSDGVSQLDDQTVVVVHIE
jgi:ligand-binding sensor domain-containing protein/serine phosphatase RsbU (regulator of sigma subunit)